MNNHLKNSEGVHLPHPFMDFTLCGDADEGDIDFSSVENTDEAVDCPKCLKIVRFCVDWDKKEPKRKKRVQKKPVGSTLEEIMQSMGSR